MKICIELDEEMEEQWTHTKSHLEFAFMHAHGCPVNLPDYIVFKGLLVCFEDQVIDFSSQFTTEEIEAICKQYGRVEL